MNRTSFSKLAIAAILPMTLSMGAAHAESPVTMNRVEVAGQSNPDIAKLNVAQACPGINSAMQEALTPLWERHRHQGLVQVQFRVQGEMVNSIAARGGPDVYSQPIRNAMRRLNCTDGSGANQLYAFEVQFKDAGMESGVQTVAMVSR
jgi:hypothetical protein